MLRAPRKLCSFSYVLFVILLFYVLDVVSITVYDRHTLLNIGSFVAQRKPDFEFLNNGTLFTDTASEPFVWAAQSRLRKRSRKRGKRAGVLVRLRLRPLRPPLTTILLANVQSLDNKLSETWMSAVVPDSAIELTGFKAAKRQYENKVEEQFNTNNARIMWQGISNITDFKGNKPATVNIAASLPDELNLFYARFEAHNTAHTESAPVAVAEEVSAISISVTDVTRSFKRVNIHKAVGPDGIPGRVLRACAFQLAGVFTDIFNLSLSLSVGSLMLQKNPPLCPYQRKIKSHA